MMKTKNLQGIICLVIFFILANYAWAADWIYYASSNVGGLYYNKSSIKKVNENIIRVWAKTTYSKYGKKMVFSSLKSIGKAPENSYMLSEVLWLYEFDCVNEKIKISSTTIYDDKGNDIASAPKSDEWENVIPETSGELLKNIVCSAGKTFEIKKK